MIQLKIEKGIPIPPITARAGANIMLLKAMAVGDSVYFDAPIVSKAVRFYRVAQKLGIKVIIRKDAKGMRMWRIEDSPVLVKETKVSTPRAKKTTFMPMPLPRPHRNAKHNGRHSH